MRFSRSLLYYVGSLLSVTMALCALVAEVDVVERRSGGLAVGIPTTTTSVSLIKRDDASKVPDGFSLTLAYTSPSLDDVKSILHNTTTAQGLTNEYRRAWITTCGKSLNASSTTFASNKTFGWFTFTRDFAKSDQVNDGVLVFNVACYEVTNFDPTGANPGKPLNNLSANITTTLGWTKDAATAKGQELIKAYAAYQQKLSAQANSTKTVPNASGKKN